MSISAPALPVLQPADDDGLREQELPCAGRQAGRSRAYQVLLVSLLSFNFGVLLFDRNALPFLMPFVKPDLQLNNTQVGLLSSALALTWAISGMVIGRYSDRSGRRKSIVVAATLAFSLCSVVSGLATSFLMLLGARLLMGFAEGGVLPVSQSLTVLEIDEKHRGMAMGMMQNLGSSLLGGALAPVLLVALALEIGWRPTFFLAAGPGIICSLLILVLVREPESGHDARTARPRRSFRSVLAERNIRICALLSLLLLAYLMIAWSFLPLFLTQIRGIAPRTMGWLMAALGVTTAFSSYLVPAISDRIGRKPVLVIWSAIGTITPLAALYFDAPPLALAAVFVAGWTVTGAYSLFMATVPSETVGAEYTAMALGIVMGTGEVFGGAAGPLLAGAAADHFGLTAPIWIMAGLSATAAMTALWLRETAPRIAGKPIMTSSAPLLGHAQ